MDRKPTQEDERAFFSVAMDQRRCMSFKYVIMEPSFDTAFPTSQFISGFMLASINTSTIGMSIKSWPNRIMNGMKMPWSKTGPEI